MTNLIIDKGKNRINWNNNGVPVSVSCEFPSSAQLFASWRVVLVLAGAAEFPTVLLGFALDGKKIFEKEPPEGFVFSYLTEHPTAGLAVVCGGKERIDGWYDWHFVVDPSTGELTKHCPAY
jgi:hypothetical protein